MIGIGYKTPYYYALKIKYPTGLIIKCEKMIVAVGNEVFQQPGQAQIGVTS